MTGQPGTGDPPTQTSTQMRGQMQEQWQAHRHAVEQMRAVLPQVQAVAAELTERYRRGGTLYTFGNGGSAADAQHLAGEMIGRYLRERRPLPAVALSTDPSVSTCIANDYGYDDVFARQVQALARPTDMVIGFSTSGTSASVLAGLRAARQAGAYTVLCTGTRADAAQLRAPAGPVDALLVAPAAATARVQEMHVLMLHLISDEIDRWAVETDPPQPDPRTS
jgi:D-sedoheptulose 7-phosphate isomerase